MEPVLLVESRDSIAWLRLNRPPLNLFVPNLIEVLGETFRGLARNQSVRLAVISGSGRAFSAGVDVKILRDLDVASAKRFIAALHDTIRAVHEAPFPVIAMLHGYCLGGAFELAMACDLRTASTGCRLGLPEIKVGVPSVIEAALMPALIGPGRAAEYLLTGELISADQALQWGLLNRLAEPEQLEAVTRELAGKILSCAPTAVRLQKELLIRWRKTDLATAIQYGINAFATTYTTGEPREAMTAFLEKRAPRFPDA
ncbi:MAG: enoyl-CoA hydratase/isomerase family protein [Candidatus Rokubacteria bacterium]|nr:enoyl-CoA hydratase/isomerase family protein [Candidatus Rokubacteria bacterium]